MRATSRDAFSRAHGRCSPYLISCLRTSG
uniref:Uncharacterized protein n=1 Tax=Anguilla anguilla TaxID=7936 RepID=A0A0E9S7D2_ANGAN